MNDKEGEEKDVDILDTNVGLSPLATPEEREIYLQQREQEMMRRVAGPTAPDEWLNAVDELRTMRTGIERPTEEEEWEFGR